MRAYRTRGSIKLRHERTINARVRHNAAHHRLECNPDGVGSGYDDQKSFDFDVFGVEGLAVLSVGFLNTFVGRQ